MEIFSTSVAAASMMLGDDGLYYGTVLATKHNLGTDVFVARAVHRNTDMTQDNVLCSYTVETNGDVKIFATEPTTIRLTLAKGTAPTSNTLGEGEEYADA